MSSVFHSLVVRLSVHLPPAGLANLSAAVASQLNNYLFHYSPQCDGVIVAYKSVRYCDSVGSILFDKPWINFDLTVEFLVLKLAIGQTMTGQIVALHSNAITLLIGGSFNAVIQRHTLPPHFDYSALVHRFVDKTKANMPNNRTGLSTAKTTESKEEGASGEPLSKKAAKKAAKLAEKEAKRAAYFASIGQTNEGEKNETGEEQEAAAAYPGSFGLGDSLLFEITAIEKSQARDYFSIQGKFVAVDTRKQIKQENQEMAVKEEGEQETNNSDDSDAHGRSKAEKRPRSAEKKKDIKVKEEESSEESEEGKKKKSKGGKEKKSKKQKTEHH